VKGAERVNQYIEQLTGRGLIRLEVTPESKFRVMRGAAQARNLSEGEMTAISLAYFVARLEDKGTNLADTIVFIDDPVSSFDHNHLFAAYALIKTKLSNCAQLFVATHNLDFFNLMKDFLREFKKPNTQRLYQDRLPCYLVQREFNALRDCALIRDAPRLLTAFKSEYVYLFALLRDFADRGGGADYEMLYLVPNVVRRFLEAYSGFTRPGCRDPDQRYSTLFPDETKRALVLKFANEHSHIQSADRTLKFPEAAECKQVVETVLAAIESCDKTHFESLCDACV
jgi:wobble nucleotide-excising tRNase